MTPDRWRQVEDLFQRAVVRAPQERSAFLDSVCNGDGSLRREVEALLASDQDGDDCLDEIASGVAAGWKAERDSGDLLGQTIGRYKILSPLGIGGMGEVFLAHDTMLERKVALKILPRQFTRDRDRLRRFEQEARAASALNHPNIITIYEIGDVEGTRFMATEYVEGETLREVIGGPRRDISEILEIGCQAAGALAAAHGAGIVHRDIKPANIMLRADGYVKVLDFGLAKLTSARAHLDVTEPGRVMGTINYMSPEQAMGQPLDHRTDIFSLGVVLYEVATGQRLFEGKSEAAVYDSILHKRIPSTREFAPTSPAEFDQVLRRALEKDPARRYQTAAELRTDLKRLAQGTGTTQAAAIELRERRTTRRKRTLRIASVTALVLAILGAAVFVGGRFAVPKEMVRKSLAVLPFENRGGEQENTFFAEGVHDQVLTDLSKIAQLKVIGRTSVLQYQAGVPRNLREIAQQLGVAYVLQGSVQRAADKVRVNAQLTDANSDTQLWAESYDRQLADVFSIQSEIAKAIAKQLQAKLSASERAEIERKPTADLTALELFTRGRTLNDLAESATERQKENTLAAIDVLNRAVQRDGAFVTAYCELARSHNFLYWTGLDRTSARVGSAR
ncbi:MAG TPA: serine/threonine-protein kinase, partial [Chthoniobacterales bacterium]|nr:serine/threonine-protein kinase [Chthoniobacterales bacterium]